MGICTLGMFDMAHELDRSCTIGIGQGKMGSVQNVIRFYNVSRISRFFTRTQNVPSSLSSESQDMTLALRVPLSCQPQVAACPDSPTPDSDS